MTRYGPTEKSAVSLALCRRYLPFLAALIALFTLAGCGLSGSATPTVRSVVPTTTVVASGTPGDATPTRVSPATPAETPAPPVNTAFGEWVAAGALGFGRAGHTATLLADGRVLVVGGEGGSAPLASVEQYDPQTNRWGAVPSLGLARSGHTATLLPSGELLVVGGTIAPSGALSTTPTVEIYDPVAGRWRGGPPLNQARSGQTATLLANGQVLVVGGETLDSTTGQARLVGSAEIYDPATNAWTVTASPAHARVDHTATLLNDGRVLIAAGETVGPNGQREISATAELFDLPSGRWSLTGDLALARANATATMLTNGQVLVSGGRINGGNATAATELFDPARGTWAVAGALNTPRADQAATRLLDGRVLVVGGYERDVTVPSASAERYDAASDSWARIAPPLARTGGRAVLLRDGAVLVVGGRTTGGRYADTAERFIPRGLVPATPGASATPRPTATPLPTATAVPATVAPATATADVGPTPEPTAAPPPVPTATTRPPTQRPPTNTPLPPRPTQPPAPTREPVEPTVIVPSVESPEPTATVPPTATALVPTATASAPTATVGAPTATPTIRITPSLSVAPPTPTAVSAATATATATPGATATTAPARTGTIFGTIQFCAGQQCAPAAGAVVSTESGATRTDDGGVYALSGVAAGTVRVNVTYTPASGGTVTALQSVAVPANGRVQLNVTLQPAAQGGDEPTAAPPAPAAIAGVDERIARRPTP